MNAGNVMSCFTSQARNLIASFGALMIFMPFYIYIPIGTMRLEDSHKKLLDSESEYNILWMHLLFSYDL